MYRKTIDNMDLKQIGLKLIEELELGDLGLSDKARAAMKIESGDEADDTTIMLKAIAEAYCSGYAAGYLRGKDRRIVTAEISRD